MLHAALMLREAQCRRRINGCHCGRLGTLCRLKLLVAQRVNWTILSESTLIYVCEGDTLMGVVEW